MTPRAIADAPIEGIAYILGSASPDAEPYLDLHCGAAVVTLYAAEIGGVFAIAGRLKTKEFWVRPETLRADLVEILAWSLNAVHPDPAAPETRAALRSPGLYGEVLRKHIEDRRDVLKALDFPEHRPLVAALSAALETST